MTKKLQTSPPTILILEEKGYYDVPIFELVKIKGKNNHDFRKGELFNDTNVDDLIEMGFEIEMVS